MTDEPKKPRRRRVDSLGGVVDAIIAAGKRITAPEGMNFTPREAVIFDEVISEHSKTELSAHKVRLAAMLAIDMAALEREQTTLRREGSVLTNSHGNAVANPRTKVVQNLTGSILAQRRSLGIHTRALEGTNQRAALRRAHNQANEAKRASYEDADNLIPFPLPHGEEEDV